MRAVGGHSCAHEKGRQAMGPGSAGRAVGQLDQLGRWPDLG